MTFGFHPAASRELDEAVAHYEDREPGLGLEFSEEVWATIVRITHYPDAWTPLSRRTRRCLLNRFPYGIIYQVKAGVLRIIAVAHLNRRPEYWTDRL
jgi:hypothetical protein